MVAALKMVPLPDTIWEPYEDSSIMPSPCPNWGGKSSHEKLRKKLKVVHKNRNTISIFFVLWCRPLFQTGGGKVHTELRKKLKVVHKNRNKISIFFLFYDTDPRSELGRGKVCTEFTESWRKSPRKFIKIGIKVQSFVLWYRSLSRTGRETWGRVQKMFNESWGNSSRKLEKRFTKIGLLMPF